VRAFVQSRTSRAQDLRITVRLKPDTTYRTAQ
jgi:hypothetical protein